jgi:restriction endonuclease Mrr
MPVDGARPAQSMIDRETGVSARTDEIPGIDSDYFDADSA